MDCDERESAERKGLRNGGVEGRFHVEVRRNPAPRLHRHEEGFKDARSREDAEQQRAHPILEGYERRNHGDVDERQAE